MNAVHEVLAVINTGAMFGILIASALIPVLITLRAFGITPSRKG